MARWQNSLKAVLSSVGKIHSQERQVEVLINTMRQVYEGLRITKLKQENLELYLKQ